MPPLPNAPLRSLVSGSLAIALAAALATPVAGQTLAGAGAVVRDGDGGRMVMASQGDGEGPARAIGEELTFAPWDTLEALARDDVVLLMRHGPTDWSMRDKAGVEPTDCTNQRLMTETGKRQMYELGALMVANDLRPGRIVVSDWCRNQETLEAMRAGMTDADAAALEGVEIENMSELNLLLSLRGAPDVAAMRDFISAWDGGDGDGPLLVISHFTNIQELTDQAVFEGQMLLLDPDQGNRVMGMLRLASAAPDVGHFSEEAE